MTHADRRRILVLAALTVLIVPLAWWLNHRSTAQRGDAGTAPVTTSTYQPLTPVFVDSNDGPSGTDNISYDTGPPPPANRMLAMMGYRQLGGGVCVVIGPPSGRRLTVLNLDTGQSTTCTSRRGTITDLNINILMNTSDFAKIADLADSPVHVRITW